MQQAGATTGSEGGPRPTSVLGASLLVGALVFGLNWAFARAFESPIPRAHDEFAYLLTADTFAHGRLHTPTHPMWVFFETFHVSHLPVYQAKYPPGQGAFMAVGQWLAGEPALGVWLSLALGCAAMTWMLARLVPLGWAIGGPLLFAINLKLMLGWGQSYWGGGVGLLGGALFVGGLLGLRRGPSLLHSSAMAVGALVLANSRPLEGLLMTLFAIPMFIVAARRWQAPARTAVLRVHLPLVLAAAGIVLWTLYYNAELTGDPLTFPHKHWRTSEAQDSTIAGYSGSTERILPGKLYQLALTYCGWPLLLALPFLLRRKLTPVLLWSGLTAIGLCAISVLGTRAWPHYVSPISCLMVLLTIEALRGLAEVRVGARRAGLVAVVLLVGTHVGWNLHGLYRFANAPPPIEWFRERQRVIEHLEQLPGQDLVFVSYPPDHNIHSEWVYNAADIDASEVVWARDKGPEANRELIEYFGERRVWRLLADDPEPVLAEY